LSERRKGDYTRLKKLIIILLLCWHSLLCWGCTAKEGQVIYDMEDSISARETDSGTETQHVSMSETEQKGRIYVYICGAVQNPGVIEVEAGARLFEALEKAGGLTAEASLSSINQAAVLNDGQQIIILTEEEAAQQTLNTTADGDGIQAQEKLININTATAEELMTLPGIGQAKAADIIRYRETAGSFQSIEDIMNVNGIKNAVFDKIKDKIVVG